MIQYFDLYNRPESPNFTLCNPDYTQIDSIIAYNRKPTLRFNDSSSLSCVVYAKTTNIDYQVVNLSCYDKIVTKRLILVENIGYFQIQNVNETDDGIEKYKEIIAISIQNDMGFKTMSWFDGTFKFYDALDSSETIMGAIMEKIPDWTIDTVSSDLLTKYRTFESVNTTLLDFILSDVSEAYECIFLFDFLNRTIKVKSIADLIANPIQTSIYFSFKNLLKKFQIEEISDDIVTALSVYGQDLDIRQVNPLGTSYIYNFTHFMTLEWMTQDLIDAITAWQGAITTAQPTYAGHLSSLQTGKAELLVLESALVDLQADLVSNENIRSARIEQGIDYSDINILIAANQADIASKQAEIDAKIASNTAITNAMTAINTSLSFANNFTAPQLLVLDKYIYEQNYTNTYYIVTDLMTPVDVQNAAQELYNEGVNALARMSQPRYTFKIDSANFMFIKDFATFTSQFQLGCQVTVELDDDVFAYPTLLEIQYNFDDPNDFALTFSDRFKLSDPVSAFEETISASHASANRSAVNWNRLNEFSDKYKDEVSDFLDNAFDVAKKAIINSNNQNQVWDASGMTFRKDENGTYANEQIKIINNQIVFTDDFWNSLKTVIGKIALSGGGTAYGVAAEVIVGRLLAGVNLIITNAGNTFRIDENGFSFVTVSGETETVVDLKDYIIDSLGDLSTTLQTQIDGKITSYYQANAPYGEFVNIATSNTNYSLYCSREGDIWYDTDISKSYRYAKIPNGSNFDFSWLETSGVPDSLYDAIDSKRQIFTVTPIVPYDVGDLWVQGADGDIYVCGTARTDAESYNLNDWSLASKYTDDSAVENFITVTYATDKSNLQSLIDGKITSYYQATAPYGEAMNVPAINVNYNLYCSREGDIWFNTNVSISYRYTKKVNGSNFNFIWEEISGVPDEIYDAIDGKKTIFTSKPNTFSVNDIWMYEGIYNATTNPNSTLKELATPGEGYSQAPYTQGDSFAYFKKNDLLVATSDSATYNPALWKKYSSNIDKSNTNFSFVLNDDGVSISNGAISMATANNVITIDPTDGFKIKKGVTDTFYLDDDGNIVTIGKITATSGAIANWTIGADTLASGNVGLYSGATYKYTTNSVAKNIRIYAGATLQATTDASGIPFVIDEDGRLKASNAYISGNIVMAGGSKIGNWNVTATAIYNLKSTLLSTTEGVYLGTDGISVGGSVNYFRVTSGGALTTTNATITGTINSSTINGSSIYGANYYSSDGNSKFTLLNEAGGGTPGVGYTLYRNTSLTVFKVESILLNTKLYGYNGNLFLTNTSSGTTQPEGSWNFQFANVTNISATAKFG